MITDRRAHFRAGLHAAYIPYYDHLCQLLGEDWSPYCGLRSFEDQFRLYSQGRTVKGPIVTKAKPGLSFHNYGLASDWDYFPSGVYTPLKSDDPRWQEYLDACNEAALRCIDWEKPHNELSTVTQISAIFGAFKLGGMDAVTELLKREGKS